MEIALTFTSSVERKIKNLKCGRRSVLPLLALERIEETGRDLEIVATKENRVMASVKNPLDVLYRSGILTREEWGAGREYQNDYALANISHHARPNYDGTPISAISVHMGEKIIKDSQIKASTKILAARNAVGKSSAERQVVGFKDSSKKTKIFSRDLKLSELLIQIFENQIAVRNVEKLLGINHRLIGDRVKKICQILLAV